MELPSPVLNINLSNTSVSIVLPKVQSITTGFDFEGFNEKIHLITVQMSSGEPVYIRLNSVEEMGDLTKRISRAVSDWYIYTSMMGPVFYGNLNKSESHQKDDI